MQTPAADRARAALAGVTMLAKATAIAAPISLSSAKQLLSLSESRQLACVSRTQKTSVRPMQIVTLADVAESSASTQLLLLESLLVSVDL